MRVNFVLGEVLNGLRRNITMTVAMILTTAVSLSLLGAGIFAMKTVNQTKDVFLDEVEVYVYMIEDVSANDENCNQSPCEGVKQELEQHDEVVSVVYKNREQQYERFKELFEDQPELLELGRPDALPASLNVRLADPTRSHVITDDFSEMAGVDRIYDSAEWVDDLAAVLNGFRNIAFAVSVLLLAAALFLIANMVQISAYTRRAEVNIMRLVGATRWYTQLPFLLEAVIAGLIGAVISIVLLFSVRWIFPNVAAQTAGFLRMPSTGEALLYIAPILLLTSIVISAVTGYVTLRLRVRI